MDHPIQARKKNLLYKRFCCASRPQSENERKQLPGSCQRAENAVEHENECDTNIVEALGIDLKNLEKRLKVLEIRGRIEAIETTAQLKLANS